MSLVVNELGKTGIQVTRLGFGAMEFRKGTKYFGIRFRNKFY